jgi:hypothetical protein
MPPTGLMIGIQNPASAGFSQSTLRSLLGFSRNVFNFFFSKRAKKHNTDPLRVASWDHTDNYSTVFGIPMFKNPTVTLRQYPVVRGVLMIPNGAEFAALMP